ncbi:MAG: putative ABC transporter permease subunit, partial [Desulfobacteraceae bacterium]
MRRFFLLLTPRLLALRHSLRRTDARTRRRTWIMLGVGLLFWGGMFLLSSRVLSYFQSVEVIGDILSRYLLGMVLLIFFSLLVFSHIITSLSALFLSEDLELCHATPASLEEVFLSRVACTIMDGSWMMVIFGLPVMLAYAWVYQAGPGFYAALAFSGLPLILIAAGVAVLLTMILVNVFPAQRTRDIMTLLTVLLVVGLYLMFRFLRPERLVDPDAFFSTLQYISALKAPDSPYLPTHWASEIIWRHLSGTTYTGYRLHFLLLWSTGAALIVINVWTAEALY